jgi:hypothetical protein
VQTSTYHEIIPDVEEGVRNGANHTRPRARPLDDQNPRSGRETHVTSSPVPPVALIGIGDSPSPERIQPNNATNGTTAGGLGVPAQREAAQKAGDEESVSATNCAIIIPHRCRTLAPSFSESIHEDLDDQ